MNLLEALKSKGYPPETAKEVLEEMRERVNDGEDPEEVLFEEGLEPDYIFDLFDEAL